MFRYSLLSLSTEINKKIILFQILKSAVLNKYKYKKCTYLSNTVPYGPSITLLVSNIKYINKVSDRSEST